MIRIKPSPQTEREWEYVRRAVDRLLSPKRKYTEPIQRAIRDGFEENFDSERAGDGPAWDRLAASTALDRIRRGYAPYHPILVRSGAYKDSFVDPSNPDHISKIERRSTGLTFYEGSDDFRVIFHEYGTTKMPKREVLTISKQAQLQVGRAVDQMAFETMRGRG